MVVKQAAATTLGPRRPCPLCCAATVCAGLVEIHAEKDRTRGAQARRPELIDAFYPLMRTSIPCRSAGTRWLSSSCVHDIVFSSKSRHDPRRCRSPNCSAAERC